MPKPFKSARQINNLKVIEAAKLLNVSQPTLSAWEGERKSPAIDSLEKMADLYNVTTDFLLGRTKISHPDQLEPIPNNILPILNGKPVWTEQYGWALVNSDGGNLILSNCQRIQFSGVGQVFIRPYRYAESDIPI